MKSNLLLFCSICFTIIALLAAVSCAKKTTTPIADTSETIQQKINTIMGKKTATITNNSGDHILCIKKEGSLLTSFMVINKSGDVIIEKKKVRGTVAWHDDDAIAVTITPGVIDKRSDQGPEKKIISIRKNKAAI